MSETLSRVTTINKKANSIIWCNTSRKGMEIPTLTLRFFIIWFENTMFFRLLPGSMRYFSLLFDTRMFAKSNTSSSLDRTSTNIVDFWLFGSDKRDLLFLFKNLERKLDFPNETVPEKYLHLMISFKWLTFIVFFSEGGNSCHKWP